MESPRALKSFNWDIINMCKNDRLWCAFIFYKNYDNTVHLLKKNKYMYHI